MSQQAISTPLSTARSEMSGRDEYPRAYTRRQSASIWNGSAPSTWRAKTSSIMACTTDGWKGAAYTSPIPLTPSSVIRVRNTKYLPPNEGGGLPTTNVRSPVIFTVRAGAARAPSRPPRRERGQPVDELGERLAQRSQVGDHELAPFRRDPRDRNQRCQRRQGDLLVVRDRHGRRIQTVSRLFP